MRVLLQRCRPASVTVDDVVVGEIERGLLLLAAVGLDDTEGTVSRVADKIAGMRVFADDAGRMNRSLLEMVAERGDGWGVLVVSQFTLYADVRKGRRPGFTGAARPEIAVPLLDAFVAHLAGLGLPVATGRFGADMQVHSVNDGPVTIWVDSDDL